ncbi:MAG: VWA domain-containing protein [Verrucomicrobiota bacterium]
MTPLLVIGIAGLIVYGMRRRESLLGNFAAPRLLAQLTEKAQTKRLWIKAAFIITAAALIGLALARPQYGVQWIERKARGLDIIFVLDSSKSMLATDLRPNRLERAKLAIIDLVERLESDRIGLVAFAGRAFLQTPPTLDYSAFKESLESINVETISSGGSDIGSAITEAANAFPQANNFKVVILLTDGEDLRGQSIEVAKEVAEKNVKIYAIGLGTPEGEYLRIRNEQGDEEFIRDSQGQPVRSQLDEATLSEIALLTGGSYARIGGDALDALYSSVIATLPREERESEMQEARIDRFQWPLGIALLFLAIEFVIRRRSRTKALSLILIAIISQLPEPLRAQEIDTASDSDLPEEIDTIETDDPRKLYNVAHGLIQEGKFAEARNTLDQSIQRTEDFGLQRDSIYNAAHSVFQEGEQAYQSQDFETTIEKWREAEELFKSAHTIDPDDQEALEDAALVQARREALEEFLEQQQQENQDQQSGDQDQQGDQNEDGEQSDSQDGSEGDQGEQDQNEQQSGQNQNQQDDGSEPENRQGEQDSDSEQSQDQGSQSQDQSDREEEEEETTDGSSEGQESEEESSEEAQSEQTTEDESSEDDAQEPNAANGENSEDEATGEGTTSGEMTQIEGMSPEQAAMLLDSLREGEKLLPFMEQSAPSDKSQKRKDW